MNEGIREGEEGNLVIAGDFNARTGEEGRWNDQEGTEEAEEGGKRRSKDEVINEQGRELIRMLEERGWFILNGGKEGDEKGEWTYEKAGGKSVIDYGIVNWEAGKKIGMFQVGCRIRPPTINNRSGEKIHKRGGEYKEEWEDTGLVGRR